MGFSNWLNSKIRKFNWTDLACVELSNIAFGLMLAALIPSLLTINVWWYAIAWVVLGLKPLYKASVQER